MRYREEYESSGPDDVEGYVYLFKCENHYKIGFSKNPAKRRKQLSTGSPLPVEHVHRLWTPFCREIESRLHRKFSEQRGRGEWFTLSEADVAHIKSIDKWGVSDEDRVRRAADAEQRRRDLTLPPPGSPEALEKALQHIEKVFGQRLDSHRTQKQGKATA